MKLFQFICFSLLFGLALTGHAVDQSVQVDILMAKIINAQKEGRAADALPSMVKLESMESTLSTPLSEGFHFLYVNTLYETGDLNSALNRANIYLEKFGKSGANYAKVVDIVGRLEEAADGDAKKEAARIAEVKQEAKRKCARAHEDRVSAERRIAELKSRIDPSYNGNNTALYKTLEEAFQNFNRKLSQAYSACGAGYY